MPSKGYSLSHRLAVGWVSLSRAARLLGISYPTAQKLRLQGRIKTIVVGNTYRVYVSEVERLLREGTKTVISSPEDLPEDIPDQGEIHE